MVYETIKWKEAIECVNSLTYIGFAYEDQAKFNEALNYYDRALSIYERVKGKESLDCSNTHQSIDSMYCNKRKLN